MSAWSLRKSSYDIPVNEVHVWKLNLEAQNGFQNECLSYLSAEEKTKAQRFHFDIDRAHFIMAHGIQRILLSRYTKIPTLDLKIARGAHGKPYCANESLENLHFNLSHSRGVALFAISKNAQVGVDVEWINPDFDVNSVVSTVFSGKEKQKLRELSGQDRLKWFFKFWTHKEAILKCLGTGLAIEPDMLELSFKDETVSFKFDSTVAHYLPPQWSLFEVNPAAEFAGALAINAAKVTLKTYIFES